jgi:5-dehydro-2-deoxygluconokinase
VESSPFVRARFLVLGRAGIDLYAHPPGTKVEEARSFTSELGGSAANIAVAVTRLDGEASILTSVSNDAVGRFVLNELRRYGVGTEYVASVCGEARNSLAIVETRLENCQNTIYRNNAADFQITPQQVENVSWQSFGGLIVTGTSLAVEPSRSVALLAIKQALANHLPIVLDVDYRPYSWASPLDASSTLKKAAEACAIVVGNDEEFAVMANGADGLKLAESLSNGRIVIYKMGEKGSITLANGTRFESGIFAVKALKPTGAGDAFMGGFVMGLARGLNVRSAAMAGSACAAIVVGRVGCAPATPTASELEDFLKAHHAHSAI